LTYQPHRLACENLFTWTPQLQVLSVVKDVFNRTPRMKGQMKHTRAGSEEVYTNSTHAVLCCAPERREKMAKGWVVPGAGPAAALSGKRAGVQVMVQVMEALEAHIYMYISHINGIYFSLVYHIFLTCMIYIFHMYIAYIYHIYIT
jgi:hypothetical protein